MEAESEPYVRLATMRQLHQAVADLNTARSLADTLQSVADGVVAGLGYELGCVNLVRPDGDLVIAAFAGNAAAEALITGRVGSRASWERSPWARRGTTSGSSRTPRAGSSSTTTCPSGTPRGPNPGSRTSGTRWTGSTPRCTPPGAAGTSSGSYPSTGRATDDDPAHGGAKRSRCTPPRPPSPSATPACAPTCSARWSGWSGSSRRCGPARSPSGRRSSTRPAAWPSRRWAATSTGGCCAPTTPCA